MGAYLAAKNNALPHVNARDMLGAGAFLLDRGFAFASNPWALQSQPPARPSSLL